MGGLCGCVGSPELASLSAKFPVNREITGKNVHFGLIVRCSVEISAVNQLVAGKFPKQINKEIFFNNREIFGAIREHTTNGSIGGGPMDR